MGLFRRKKIEEIGMLPKDGNQDEDAAGATRQEDSASSSSSSPKGSIFHNSEGMANTTVNPILQRIGSEIQRIGQQIDQAETDVEKARSAWSTSTFDAFFLRPSDSLGIDSDPAVSQLKLSLSVKEGQLEKLKERKFDLESQYQLEAEKIAGVTKNTGSVSRTSPLSEHAETVNSFCTKCGKPLKPTAKFCGGCGTPRS